MRKVALLSVLLVIFAVPALAASLPNYGTLKLGGYFPQNSDTGFNGEIALGHYFNPNVAMELSVGYLKTSCCVAGASADITSYPILLSIKGVAPFSGGELYALAGGGLYITNLDASPSGVDVSSDDTPFGFHLGAGGNFNVSPNVFLGLEVKYFWAKPSFSWPGVTSVDVRVDGTQATANIGYRF